MKNKIRVTKYNPKFRGKNGGYLKDDWTSVSDIGKKINGEKLTFSDYQLVEQRYINAIYLVLQGVKGGVVINKLEKTSYFSEHFPDEDLGALYKSIVDGEVFNTETLVSIVKLILRECIWCEIHDKDNNLIISFGYDYYMYFNSSFLTEENVSEIRKLGLFVEN